MDARLLDIVCAIVCFFLLLALVLTLPAFMAPGIAYLLSIIIFIFAMSGAGIAINRAII
ncbi:MAG: hypothetical protein QHH04_04020 [Methanolinea sp.]|nr:hypothetical protein [Methanolinea sp.]